MVGGGSPAGPRVSCPRGDGTWIPGSRKSPFHIFFCCVVIPSYHQPIAMTHLRRGVWPQFCGVAGTPFLFCLIE